ncbi:helix-turn-helix transcriptional regulator [Rhizobium sp. 16-449-1b]|uniref:helix-turn-helix domain-containing protein n=1 Tax=Rhizobium sp. 16-449-1b TaxID=2819989 RepID=UPI001ADD1104|nr:helix-turn-helix transcriptional regulator [Rhizobium sp. 16-449-1b]MBO9195952.1 helix-turn-helix transcriptional regulator [Rhizobium sp. 16-449-1b]
MSASSAIDARSSNAISEEIGQKLERLRLSRNITQSQLAADAGISERTLRRLESGDNPTLDSLLRVLIALKVQQNIDLLVPDSRIRPIERVRTKGAERQRSSSAKATKKGKPWEWGTKG